MRMLQNLTLNKLHKWIHTSRDSKMMFLTFKYDVQRNYVQET